MAFLVLLTLGWLAGIWTAAQFSAPWWAWLILTALGGVGLLALRQRPALRWPLAVLLCLGLGGLRYQLSRPAFDASFIATYNDQGAATVEGVVADAPDVRDTYVNLRVSTESLRQPGQTAPRPVHGLVLVAAPRYSETRRQATGAAEFQYGDRVSVSGQLIAPPEFESFSYKDYLARQDIYALMQGRGVTFIAARQGHPLLQALFDFKAHALAVLAQIFPEPHAALLSGILLGVDSNLPADIKDAFSATGTSHIIAISGFNIAIIAGIFALLANRLFGARYGALVAILGIALYTVLVGASASVVRAAIMGSLALVAQRLGRRVQGLNTLAVAVFAMTLLAPETLWDVGFQLSVGATLGLVLYAEPLEAGVKNLAARFIASERAERVAALAGELILLTVAAQITTLPLMAYYFRSVSLISLIANLLILPPQPALMVLAGVALILGLITLPLGTLAAWLAWPFSAYTLALVQLLAKAPGATIYLGDVAPWLIVGYYLLLLGLTWLSSRPAEQRPAWWKTFAANWLPIGALSVLAISVVVAWSYYFSLPDGRLKVVALDVGQGDGILIQTPGGAHVLVDGGPSSVGLNRALAGQLPLFTRQLDLLVVASPRDESVASLPEALRRYAVQRVVLTQANDPEGAAYPTLRQLLASQNTPVTLAIDRPSFDLGGGITLRVLSDGDHGSVLRLEWKRFALLLPIGALRAEENTQLKDHAPLPATALLLADHGSERANGEEWLWAINPRVAIVSVGADNRLGVPAPKILDRLAGRAILRTDQNGALTLFTDGEQLWMETER